MEINTDIEMTFNWSTRIIDFPCDTFPKHTDITKFDTL